MLTALWNMPQKKLDKWAASITWKTVKPCNILLQTPITGYCVHWSILSSLLMTEVCFLWTCVCPVMTDCWCSRSNRMLDFVVCLVWTAHGFWWTSTFNGWQREFYVQCNYVMQTRVLHKMWLYFPSSCPIWGESCVEFQAASELKLYYGCDL